MICTPFEGGAVISDAPLWKIDTPKKGGEMRLSFKEVIAFLAEWRQMDQEGRELLVASIKEIIADNKEDVLKALRDGRCKG